MCVKRVSICKKVFLFALFFVAPAWAGGYTINLMWINASRNDHQNYIYPAYTQQELYDTFLKTVFDWAQGNPEGTIIVWFDSAMVPFSAVQATNAAIKHYQTTDTQETSIVLRDIRTLTYVQQQSRLFSDETPIYFRADLLRAVIAVAMFTEQHNNYWVYADLDMKPLTQAQLFDQETVDMLERYGILFAHGGWHGFEYGFHIINLNNQLLRAALQHAIIDINSQRAYYVLSTKGTIHLLDELVYHSLPAMLAYFYHLSDWGTLLVKNEDTSEQPYDKNLHGFEPFGVPFIITASLVFTPQKRLLHPIADAFVWAPTKKVPLKSPTACLSYFR